MILQLITNLQRLSVKAGSLFSNRGLSERRAYIMKKSEFINLAKRMVREYYNRYVNVEKKIYARDVRMIKFADEPNYYRSTLVDPYSENTYYGVTYDKLNDEIHSYLYKNDGFRTIGRKESL